MRTPALENKYYNDRSVESNRSYKKQNNFCSRVHKKERRKYLANLEIKKIFAEMSSLTFQTRDQAVKKLLW